MLSKFPWLYSVCTSLDAAIVFPIARISREAYASERRTEGGCFVEPCGDLCGAGTPVDKLRAGSARECRRRINSGEPNVKIRYDWTTTSRNQRISPRRRAAARQTRCSPNPSRTDTHAPSSPARRDGTCRQRRHRPAAWQSIREIQTEDSHRGYPATCQTEARRN